MVTISNSNSLTSKESMKKSQLFFQRYKRAKSRADEWAAILEACFYFAVPFRDRFYKPPQSQGELNNRRLYDSTGVEATNAFVSKIHSSMTPPQVQWGYLQFDDDIDDPAEENDVDQANRILADYMKRVFDFLHTSNFDVVVGEAYFDLAVGTASLVPNYYKEDNPLLFTSIPIDQLAIEESIDGTIKSWFRTWTNIKVREIPLKWKNAKYTSELSSLIRDNPDAVIQKFIEGVTFNPENKKMPFTYSGYTEKGDDPVFEEDLENNPGIIWRFQKTNNEWWGRGPVMSALPAMMRANEMGYIEYASANLNTFRPYMGFSDGVFNPWTFQLKPMTVIPIAQVARDQPLPLIPLPDASNPAFAQMTIGDLRTQINNLLFADPLGPVEGPPKTATELAIRQQNLAEKIGPLFTRLQQEFLWPVLQRVMYILNKSGHLKTPQFKGKNIRFKYRSPLALAQGQQDIAILTQFVQVMQGIFGPDVTQLWMNPSDTPYMLADKLQVDLKFLQSKEKINQLSEQMLVERNRIMAQQEAMMKAQAQGGAQNGG